MKYTGLILFICFLCCNVNSQSVLSEKLVPQGHKLDCINRCKNCLEESTFDAVYEKYNKSLTKPENYKKEDLLKLLGEEAAKLSNIKGRRVSETEKVDEEIKKSEAILDQEVKVAVDKVIKSEGNANSEKIKDIAQRIRKRMVEKYRKEASERLGVQAQTEAKTETKVKAKSLLRNRLTQEPLDKQGLYRVYFDVCVNNSAGTTFYA
jgi:hypothetical protein